ncbi:helix-turn-helix domain-containing protein [Nonomuraea sp. NPDC049141]|uniref:helix-turn-helix transcriptional regulator n=1 Tax=Nonomuraea sp. NPDC049141 TaxID=3155500 RepID=UPI0033C2BA43
MATVTRLHAAMLTLPEVCTELQVSRSTFYDWRQKGRAPRCITLPNGSLRIRRADLDNWLNARQDAA